jgi:NAD(P)-dependent dehydrogenase (short-subunit alcohol dehydrogenase family)
VKNYLIIGGSSGIGQAIVTQLAAEGHQVFATYNQHAGIINNYPSVHYHRCNVLDDSTLNFDYLPDTLDGIAYCPGSIQLKPFGRIKPEDFVADYQLQVVGAIKVIQAVTTRLKNAGSSSIVLFSTVAAQTGLVFHTQVAASKSALEGLSKALAAELAPQIRCNCIAPSLTNTPLAASLINTEAKLSVNAQRHPLKRIGEATDIAEAACFLLSNKSSWITGQILHVDGGLSTLRV